MNAGKIIHIKSVFNKVGLTNFDLENNFKITQYERDLESSPMTLGK